jgi:hypothetical protein
MVMMNRVKKIVVLAMVLCLLGSSVAFATDNGSATVNGTESVTITNFLVSTFSAITLDGTTKTATSEVTNMTLVDARGTGAGWSVNLTATQFTNASASNGTLLKDLPLNSLALGTVSVVAGTDSTPTTNISLGSGTIDKSGGVKILNAGINEGMGTYTISIEPMTLTFMPKDAKAGTYTSTITMTLSQGPVV